MDTYLILFIIGLATQATSNVLKSYRTDYVYNAETDAFYKLHIDVRRGWIAPDYCAVEGATLMVPTHPQDLVQLHGMLKQYPDLGDHVFVSSDGLKHESAEEKALIEFAPEPEPQFAHRYNLARCTVVNRNGEIETMPCYKTLPFFCKVDAKDIRYDTQCRVYGRGYEYVPAVKSCYKIPSLPYSWNEAYAFCRAEGSHLVVINSAVEDEIVMNLARTAKVQHPKAPFFLYVGFRADEPKTRSDPVVFKTVFNETLEEAGYVKWFPNEPNNAGFREYCGTIYINTGEFNDVDCSHKYGYICEKEVP